MAAATAPPQAQPSHYTYCSDDNDSNPSSSSYTRARSHSSTQSPPPPPNYQPPAPPSSAGLPTTCRLTSSSSFRPREPPPALPPLPPLPSIGSLEGTMNTNGKRDSRQPSVRSSTSSRNSSSHPHSVYYPAVEHQTTSTTSNTPVSSPTTTSTSTSTSTTATATAAAGYGSAITTDSRPTPSTSPDRQSVHAELSSRPRNKKKLGINTATPTMASARHSTYQTTSPPAPPHEPAAPKTPPVPSLEEYYPVQERRPSAQGAEIAASRSSNDTYHSPPRSAPATSTNCATRLRPINSLASVSTSRSGPQQPPSSSSSRLLNSVKNYNPMGAATATNLLQSVSGPAKFYNDQEAKIKLKLLASSDAKFDEVIEFGFPVVPEKEDYELASANVRKPSVSSYESSDVDTKNTSPIDTHSESNQWGRRISMVPREMTLKITLSPATMRADEEAIYGWQRDNIDSDTVKSTKSLGMVEEDEELPPPRRTFEEPPASPGSSVDAPKKMFGKKMFSKLKKPKEKTANPVIITSSDVS